ncbi:MAG: DUF58 domain-containing protein [Roseiflexus sp.]
MWFRNIFSPKLRAEIPPLFNEAFLRRLERLSLQAQRTLRGRPSGGAHLSHRLLPTSIFSDHRPYSIGDDYRYVDWNVYAHQDALFVKLGEIEQDVTVHLLIDASRSMAWGSPAKLRAVQLIAGTLGYLALAHNDRLHVTPFDATVRREFGPVQGKSRLIEMLRFIEQVQPGGETNLRSVLEAYARRHPRGGLLVVCSDLLAPDGLEEGLRAYPPPIWQTLVLHLLDPRELSPERLGPVEIEDIETGKLLPLVIDDETIAHYRHNLAVWQRTIESICGRRGATYARVLSTWPLERQIIPYLRARRILT